MMPPLSPPALALLQSQLADAAAALHTLRIGRLPVEVVVDGYVVKYTHATVDDLQSYVDSLQAQLTGRETTRGAIGFVF